MLGILKEDVARIRTTDDILLSILEEFQTTPSVEFLRKPFEKKWDLAWFPTILFNGAVVVKPCIWFLAVRTTKGNIIGDLRVRFDDLLRTTRNGMDRDIE
jgi:hypothetical protein